MRTLLLLVAAILGSSAAIAAPASPAGIATFKTFTATCNNLAACVAIGTATDDLFYVRIAREAGARTAPSVSVVLVRQEPIRDKVKGFTLTVQQDGKPIRLPLLPASLSGDDTQPVVRADLPAGEDAARFIDAIRNGTSLNYAYGKGVEGTLDLGGLAAALRFIDDRQGRAGTPTALVARGMTPFGQVREPPPVPEVHGAPGPATAIAKPDVPRAMIDMATPVCDPEVVKAQDHVEAWDLGGGTRLFSIPCFQGSYWEASALYLTDPQANIRPIALQHAAGATDEDAGDAPNVVKESAFDPKTMTLSSFSKGRGIADCGSTRSWVWTGAIFALLDATELEACPGALSEDWPSLFTAKRVP